MPGHDIGMFAFMTRAMQGIALDSLTPGTALLVTTLNSHYRFVVLLQSQYLLVQGGAKFPEWTVVRFDGATAGGSAIRVGWILVGFQMEMVLGAERVRSSRVRSISIEGAPVLPAASDGPH